MLTNLIGLSTVYLIDMAAPPRVSPSSLVSTTPVKSSRSLKALAVLTASWPVIESTTKSISFGFTAALMSATSFIIASSIARRPAVSIITTPWPFALAYSIAFCAMETALLFSSSMCTGTPICSPSTRSCSMAAGRYISAATSRGLRLFFALRKLASLPENVVLPEPCRPAMRITVGFPVRSSSSSLPPIRAASSSFTIFTINWPGLTEVITFSPMAFSFTLSVNSLAIL